MDKISSMDDFYQYIQNWLFWIPKEGHEGKDIYNQLCLFYFIFDQKAVLDLQSPIKPGQADKPLSWISDWYGKPCKSFFCSEAFETATLISPPYLLCSFANVKISVTG